MSLWSIATSFLSSLRARVGCAPTMNQNTPSRWAMESKVLFGMAVTTALLAISGCQSDPWSQMPYSMGCKLYTDGKTAADTSSWVDPPDPIRIVQARLAHLRDQRLEISVEFVAPPQIADFAYILSIGDDNNFVQVNSPEPAPGLKLGWMASGVGDPPWDNILQSVNVRGRFLDIILDLNGNEAALGKKPYRPSLNFVSASWSGANVAYKGQHCERNIPVGVRASAQETKGRPATRNPDTNLRWRFRSPTGNIRCDLDGTTGQGTAQCEVLQHTYQPQMSPDCKPSWVNTLILKQGKPATPSCSPRSQFPDGLPQQGYGYPLTVGAITCVLDRDAGIRCEDPQPATTFGYPARRTNGDKPTHWLGQGERVWISRVAASPCGAKVVNSATNSSAQQSH